MPEAAEVRRTADWLERTLVRCVVRSVAAAGRFEKQPIARLEELKGKKVLGVRCRGKVIVIDLEDDLSAISRLGMTGRWSLLPGKHVALVLGVELPPTRGISPVYYLDQRRFGSFFVTDKRTATGQLDELGWDALAEPKAIGKASVRALKYRNRATKVCEVMLDQEVFAGCGNYLRAEAMYRAGIDPWREWRSLLSDEIRSLCETLAEVVREAYEAGGATLESYYGGDGERGDYVDRLRVYGRKHDPQGRPVSKEKDATGRTVWWVPEVQGERA